MKNLTIRAKLIMLICITLIPVIIVQTINIYYNFKRDTDQRLQANVELAQAISTSYFNYIEELWVQELIISKEILTEPDNTKKIQSYLESVINTEETALHRLSWVNPQGTATASTLKYMIGQSIAEREYFKKILAGEEKVFADLTKSYIDGTSVVPVARAVRKDGKLIGVLVASIDTNRLVSYIPNIKLNPGDILRLVDSNGNIVYDNTRSTLTFEERKMPSETLLEEAFQGKISKISKYKSSLDGVYRMGVGYPMKELGWVCYISSVRSLVLEDTYRVAVQSIVCSVVVLVISLLVSYKFGKRIVEPLLVLKSKADELKEGNYSVRTNITGSDEIESTAEAFDLMADSIEQYDKMKSQFFSNLSHEFKTPINVIYSSIQLIESFKDTLKDDEFKNKTIKNISGIKQNCYRLMRLVDNMIDVTRYDSGNLKMNLYNLNIVSIIENVSLSVVKFAEQKDVTIIFDTDVEEKEIACDPYMIERILLNLISNSLKFTDEGGFIYINVYDKEDKVIFSVRDTGIGIPEDKLTVIFDRFRQIDTSLSRNQEGSGLGLSIVKALVDAQKGSITVSSELGKGTEFIVELPATLLPQDNKENERMSFENRSNTIQKIQIEFSDIYSIRED